MLQRLLCCYGRNILARPLTGLTTVAFSTSLSDKRAETNSPIGAHPPSSSSMPPFTYRNIVVETRGKVRTIGLNRPERRNAVNHATAKELYHAFMEFDEDSGVSVAVLYGNGGTFCAGYDLKELADGGGAIQLLRETEFGKGPAPMGPTHSVFSKPVLAAVSGYAVAGGLELALMADLRVAEEGATFGVFSRRFGVPLIDGGTVRLPALIGLSRALDMILTGRPVQADEALEIGLANRVVAKGQVFQETLKLANQMAEFPQECLKHDRSCAYHSVFNAQGVGKNLEYELREGLKVIEEAVRGAQRFSAGEGRGGNFK